MRILSWLLGNNGGRVQVAEVSKFVTEQAFLSNLASQTEMSPATVAQLREHGVSPDTKLRLEYLFYTNATEKAEALAKALETEGYTVEYGPSASDKKLIEVTGWTTPIRISNDVIVQWTREMTHLGYQFDAEFDGWGTIPNP